MTNGTEISDFIVSPPEVLSPSSSGLNPSLVSILSTNTIITISIEIVSKHRNTIEGKITFYFRQQNILFESNTRSVSAEI